MMDDIMEYAGKTIYVIINEEREITGKLQANYNGSMLHIELEDGNIEDVAVEDVTEYGLA